MTSNLAFSPNVSFVFKWCSHIIMLTWLQLGGISISFHPRSDFYMVVNQSMAVHALPMHMLILLSVDEILLPRYMNWSTNFRDFLLNDILIEIHELV